MSLDDDRDTVIVPTTLFNLMNERQRQVLEEHLASYSDGNVYIQFIITHLYDAIINIAMHKIS